MRLTIQEMADGDTTTSTSGVSSVQGKLWLKEILAAASRKMFFEQFAYQSVAPGGIKDVAIPVPSSHITFTSTTSEAASARTKTQIDNMATVTFTPATVKYGVAISKDVIRTSQVDYIAFAREELAYQAALTIDNAFATAIAAASSPAATLFGGDATAVAGLEAGDILTTDLAAKAQRYLKANNWQSELDRPFVLFVPAVCEEAFLKDSQFVNAAEYGGREVVMNGEIGKYLGMKVIVSEGCPSKTATGASWGVDGHMCFLCKARVSYGIVYGEKPTLEYEFKMDEAAHFLYLDMCYQCKTLQENSIVIIDVADA